MCLPSAGQEATSVDRSRLPVPIACEMPIPARASKQVTACMPVPDAPIGASTLQALDMLSRDPGTDAVVLRRIA
jgi:hypothetical protein